MSTPGGQGALDIEWALADLAMRSRSYQIARRYLRGDQPLAFASEKFLSAFGGLFGATPTNLMPIAIDAVADRLVVAGFDAPEPEPKAVPAPPPPVPGQPLQPPTPEPRPDPETLPAGMAWALWEQNLMDRGAGQVHQEALTCGDSFLIVWPDETGTVRFWLQEAEQIAVRYDEGKWNTLGMAAKLWTPMLPDPVTGKRRTHLTLWYPDRVERWITRENRTSLDTPTKAAEFVPYIQPGLPAVERNPYGRVPVFHFANNAPFCSYGSSELRDLIPVQDKFNKTTADMLVAMEFASYPQRYAVGFEPDIDPVTGKPRSDQMKPGVDRFLTFASELVKVGQFATADLAQFLAVLNAYREEVAIVAGLPLHYMMPIGRYPSGEAIKMAEGRLTAKVKDRQISFGQTWTDATTFALAIDTGTLTEGISTIWMPSETRNDLLQAQTQLVKQQLGVSKQQSLIELGYSAEDVEDMLADDQAQAAALSQLAAALAPPPGAQPITGSKGSNPDPNIPTQPTL